MKAEERWKVVEPCPDYEVSTHGRVRRCTPASGTHVGRLHSTRVSVFGYMRIELQRSGPPGQYFVHLLVLDAFGPPKPTPAHECNHIDGDKLNNHISNLEWVTRTENIVHAFKLGLHSTAKLTVSDVKNIRARVAAGEQRRGLADEFGVTPTTISHVVLRRTWKDVE